MRLAVTNSFLYFQLFHVDERLYVFALRTSGLGLVCSMTLYDQTDIQSIKSTWPILTADLNTRLPPPEGNN